MEENKPRLSIYVAGAAYNLFLLEIFMRWLETMLHEYTVDITSGWIYDMGEEDNRRRYIMDIENGVDKADLVIAVYPYGQHGTLCEMAYAAGKGKKVIYVRDDYFVEEDPLIVGKAPIVKGGTLTIKMENTEHKVTAVKFAKAIADENILIAADKIVLDMIIKTWFPTKR